MRKIYKIHDLNDKECFTKVKNAVENVSGVKNLSFDLKKEIMEVEVDNASLNKDIVLSIRKVFPNVKLRVIK